MIKREAVCFLLREELDGKFPLGEIAGGDCLEHVAPVEILVRPTDLDGLVPNGGL